MSRIRVTRRNELAQQSLSMIFVDARQEFVVVSDRVRVSLASPHAGLFRSEFVELNDEAG